MLKISELPVLSETKAVHVHSNSHFKWVQESEAQGPSKHVLAKSRTATAKFSSEKVATCVVCLLRSLPTFRMPPPPSTLQLLAWSVLLRTCFQSWDGRWLASTCSSWMCLPVISFLSKLVQKGIFVPAGNRCQKVPDQSVAC